MSKTQQTEAPAETRENDPVQNGADAESSRTIRPPRLQADLDRFRDLALRSQADFDNYKKRAAREKEEAIKYANSSLLERLIAIIDNFELGLSAARGEGENSPIYSGMSMVLKQLTDFLADNGLAADRRRRPEVRPESARSDRARAERRRRRRHRHSPDAPRLSAEGPPAAAVERRRFERRCEVTTLGSARSLHPVSIASILEHDYELEPWPPQKRDYYEVLAVTPRRDGRRDQALVSQARGQVSPGQKPGRHARGGEIQGTRRSLRRPHGCEQARRLRSLWPRRLCAGHGRRRRGGGFHDPFDIFREVFGGAAAAAVAAAEFSRRSSAAARRSIAKGGSAAPICVTTCRSRSRKRPSAWRRRSKSASSTPARSATAKAPRPARARSIARPAAAAAR